MADDSEVRQKFIADAEEYIQPIRDCARAARDFAEGDRAAREALDALRDAMASSEPVLRELASSLHAAMLATAEQAAAADEADVALAEYRDKLLEVAEAAAKMRDDTAEAGTTGIPLLDKAMAEARDKAAELAAAADYLGVSLYAISDESKKARDRLVELGFSEAEAAAAAEALASAVGTAAAAEATMESGTVLLVGGIAALVAAAAPVVAGITAAGSAIAAFGALAVPDILRVKDALDGTAKATGPIAAVVHGVDQLKAELKEISGQSGIGRDFLGDIPEALGIAERLMTEIVPLAQAGARSFREIEDALSRATGSQGFTQFLATMAKYAPEATGAILGLAGALGGDLASWLEELAPEAVQFTDDVTGLVTALKGPLGSALILGAQALNDWYQAVKPLLPVIDQLGGAVSHLSGLFHALTVVASGPVGIISSMGQALHKLVDPSRQAATATRQAGDGARQAGQGATAMGSALDQVATAAGHAQSAVTDLTAAFAKSLDPQAAADQAAITYHNDLATLLTDLKASHDQIGEGTQAMRDSFSAYVTVAQDAEAYAEKLLDVHHNAAGAREVLRDAIAELDATGVHSRAAAQLVRDLAAALRSIPRNVDTNINTYYHSNGSPGAGSGGVGHRVPYGVAALAGVGAAPAAAAAAAPSTLNVRISLENVMSHPAQLQAFARHMQEAAGDFASRASGSFLVLPGKHAGY